MNDEQRRYLEEGNAHRARYYGAAMAPADLTLALAWWRAYWQDMADRAAVRNAELVSGDLFDGR